MNNQNPEGRNAGAAALPKIMSKEIVFGADKWSVSFYIEYKPAFLDEQGAWKPGFEDKFIKFINPDFKNNFRVALTFETFPFLAGFFLNEKKILICSTRTSRELFLISSLRRHNTEPLGNNPPKYSEQELSALKSHVYKVVALASKTFPSNIEIITAQYNLPDLLNGDEFAKAKNAYNRITARLLSELNAYHSSIFEKLTDFGLNLAAGYALLRVHLLKFLAILPSLDYDKEGGDVKRIFLEMIRRVCFDSNVAKIKNIGGDGKPLPEWLLILFKFSYIAVTLTHCRLFAFAARNIVKTFARRFIAGESIGGAKASLAALRFTSRDSTIDQLGELVVSEKEADRYCDNVIKIIRGLSSQIEPGETNKSGILRANVSVKVSALSFDFKPEAPEYTYNSVGPRLKRIFLAAKEEKVFINIDAEHYRARDLVLYIFKRTLLETKELRDFAWVGIVVQAYLRDAYPHFLEILELAEERGFTMPIRLVKGAYWDAETIEARAFEHDAPQFLNKEETDIHFRQIAIMIMKSSPHVQLCLASHNLQDHCFAEAVRKVYFASTPQIEHQCLYMTCEALSMSMAAGMDWTTRNYVPVGSLLVGMGYLVRRIMENSSMAGVLTIMRSHKKHEMVKDPDALFVEKKRAGKVVRDPSIMKMSRGFSNAPPALLYLNDQKEAVINSLNMFQNSLGMEYKQGSRLNGAVEEVRGPSDAEVVVGCIRFCSNEDVGSVVKSLHDADRIGGWRGLNPVTRASILLKAADIMLARRLELTSLIVYESGKIAGEAVADVNEAIDFVNFYAREEVLYSKKYPAALPRGVFAVISPWNFPIAISCGMSAAALVAGNTVALKSSKQTPLIAQLMTDIFHDAGVPRDVFAHLPGSGHDVGPLIVNDDRVNGIAFTGSKEVGVWIAHQASKRLSINSASGGIKSPVKVVAEMGGKNPIIITANAELDETVSASLYSCFGHAGQKCSAASRLLVDERIIERFATRFKDACAGVCVGRSFVLSTSINPVISGYEKARLIREGGLARVEAVKNGGKALLDRLEEDLPGHCVGPLVLQITPSLALKKDGFAQKELFGPIIHIIPYKTLKQAVKIANATEYGLTAGIFSQSQDDIDYLAQNLQAGNIYVNRGNTGARVGIEPFGGFKLSGTGPKAGHKDYLRAFHFEPARVSCGQKYLRAKSSIPNAWYKHIKLASQSKISAADRIGILRRAIAKFVKRNLELDSASKAEFEALAKWLENDFIGFISAPMPNRRIPGQLSYNDHSMIKGNGLLVAMDKNPNKIAVCNLIFALAAGSGVNIISPSMSAYNAWEQICACFFESGISAENLDIKLANDKLFNEALDKTGASFIIVDGNADNVREVADYISRPDIKDRKYMQTLYSNLDGPQPCDWEAFVLQFVFVRSMAVNTMRHGAPLEIEA